MNRREPTLIGSVQRALRLVNEIGAADGYPLSAKALSSRTKIPLPTTYHLLRTLVFEGYVHRVDDGYVLGEQITGLAVPSTNRLTATRVRPTMNTVLNRLQTASYFAVWEDGEILLSEIVDGPQAERVELWVGFEAAGHATAIGKCMLAAIPSAEREDYLARHELADLTSHTITDRRLLDDQLERARSVTTDDEEYALGTACAAVPIVTASHHAVLAISFPKRRLHELDNMATTLYDARRRIELALGVEETASA